MIYLTRSVKGREREVNHDCAAAVCDGDRGLFLIVDGTTKPGSCELAQALVQGVIDAYRAHIERGAEDFDHSQVEQLLRIILKDLHHQLFATLTGTASYLVAVVSNGKLTVAYEGDCSCGIAGSGGAIEWFTSPHCRANWKQDRSHIEIAQDPARNQVTRSLRPNRLPDPFFVHQPAPAGARFICATDGFWAELTEEQQAAALNAPSDVIASASDDVTWIDVTV
ncbi:PP2C family serine/threonine-protein phosphatase [Pseudomonas sp. LS-2]|uniref:PP2C family protein-serine/threonine phosphatase n=1 Tax=Pseudomonas sp. LS-2 TaxID=2315859 RepID=UPI000E732D14|nr:serine/threonine protein phosphatase [Pseudomonas sp. LS-2]RJX80314.1 serine/threonine protein phosphatase [Pseudomonas sp. LS-2]